MNASKTLCRSKQSLDTAMCLKHVQETISTFLWDYGAKIPDSVTKLANFPKLTLSVLRMQGLSGVLGARNTLLMSASKISCFSKKSLGTAMCLEQTQETISTFLWGVGADILGSHIKLSKREENNRVTNYPKLIFSASRMQGLSGIFVRNLMTASMISWHSKQSLGTAMCLQYGQETMSTFLWGVGAII